MVMENEGEVMANDGFSRNWRRVTCAAGWILAFAGLASTATAQEQGPIKPPPASSTTSTAPAVTAPASTPARSADKASAPESVSARPREGEGEGLRNEPPSIPVEQVIAKFAQHESDFRVERDNYTYTQMFVVQTIDDDGRPDGEYRMTSDIVFTPDGKRYEKVTYAPESTLERIQLSPEDMQDLEHVQPFVLTAEDLPKYDVKYVGRERLDELDTYVFDVGPKKIEKGQRYFQGRIWVEDRDLAIVKTYGKAVPDIRKKDNENVFPKFETYRENIEKDFWFPTMTRSDDVLHFSAALGGDVHIKMMVRYSNYKRFNVRIQIKPDNTH
jgi:hypothetical protein